MRKIIRRCELFLKTVILIALTGVFMIHAVNVYAADNDASEGTQMGVEYWYEDEAILGWNYDTEYSFIIDDFANIIADVDEKYLIPIVSELTEYENIACLTISENEYGSSEDFAKAYSAYYGDENNTVFLIDMDNRNVWIYTNGQIKSVINDTKIDIITDNIYEYASDGNYYECAKSALEQILSVIKGERIAQPMKYISNICLAVVLSLLINFLLMAVLSSDRKASVKERLGMMKHSFDFSDAYCKLDHVKKTYSPQSSSDGGSSGGGGGGGSSGGHSF